MNVLGRQHWKARAPRSITAQNPDFTHTVVIHHTAGKRPFTAAAAKRELRNIQRQHMDANGWSDIGYNFIIDGWGRVWEGRGYRRVGAHTLNHNTNTIGVSFMGNYEHMKLNERQLQGYHDLLRKLRAHGFRIDAIKGHRQMPDQSTACPGVNIMRQLNL